MPVRCQAAEVIAVLTAGKDYDTVNNPDVVPYIRPASAMVNVVDQRSAGRGYGKLDPDLLKEMEVWLAAHMYCLSDKTYQSKSTQGASASFTGQTGKGFESTLYGQNALRLDFTGMLDVIDKRRFASSDWLGKPPSSQIPADQRGW